MIPVLCSFLFCNNIIAEKGKYNIEGIFYRIHAISYPCRHRCFVVVGWYGNSGSHTFGLRFLSPDKGRVLFEVPAYHFSLSEASPYFNGIIEAYLPLESEGTHWFEVLLNDTATGFFPIHVETLTAGVSN